MEKKKKHILVVEDERAIGKVLTLKLEKSGFDVQYENNGELGLEAVDNSTFDLILLDLVMPVMDGFEFLEQLGSKKVKTPVIVLTNLSQDNDLARAKELGAKDYFIKSNTPLSEIVEKVNKTLK